MKKILTILIIGFILSGISLSYAIESTNEKTIKFIYVNGSNSNDQKAKEAYMKGFHKLHKQMKAVFEKDEFITEHLLKNNEYKIDADEDVMFWGFQSRQELDTINNNLAAAKRFSPSVSQHLRGFLAHCMHDAVWVQRNSNMQRIIDQLHKKVMKAEKDGQKVVLLGHSAGSFVTYEYLLHKLKAGKVDFLTGKKENKYTCLDAVLKSEMAFLSADDRLIKNPNEQKFQEGYNKLDEYTKCNCAADDTISGIINFGSPLSLFYSSQISNSRSSDSAYKLHFLKYLQSNDMFFLTVNYADDPIGFPVNSNISKNDIEMEFNAALDENGRGFVYNDSKVRSRITFMGAHFAYWKLPKRFSKAVKDAYIKGYKNFYEIY